MNDSEEMLIKFAEGWMKNNPDKPNKQTRKIVIQFARLIGRMMKEQLYVKKTN